MISVDWKKGETNLSGTLDTIMTELALVVPPIVELLRRVECPDPEMTVLKQIKVGLSMEMDEHGDYIITEKYERGGDNA